MESTIYGKPRNANIGDLHIANPLDTLIPGMKPSAVGKEKVLFTVDTLTDLQW